MSENSMESEGNYPNKIINYDEGLWETENGYPTTSDGSVIDYTYKLKNRVPKGQRLNNNIQSNGGAMLDNNELLSKFMDKVDQDRRDSDARTEQRLTSTAERMDERLNRIEDSIKAYSDKVDTKISGLENKIDNKITLLEGKIDNNNKFILGIAISTIIGIAAIVVSVLIK